MSASDIPIIDSHVHLWPADDLTTIAWLNEGDALYKQQSVEDYHAATGPHPNLRGFVYVETDRKNGDGKDYTFPLREIAYIKRLALGQPEDGQGHTADDAALCLGLVPWAPLQAGPAELEKYIEQVKEAAGEAWPKIKGFRYLLQDKAAATMLKDDFIEGLKLLGRKKLSFDLGVDHHRRGRAQMEEVVEMIDRAHERVPDEDKVVFILNHLGKPDLTIINPNEPAFIHWRTAMFTLSQANNVYVKLSGLFLEMPESLHSQPAEDVFAGSFSWLAVLLAAFGADRIMFGSDWPVCTLGPEGAWEKWRKVVERFCWMATMDEQQQRMIWGGTAKKAYALEV